MTARRQSTYRDRTILRRMIDISTENTSTGIWAMDDVLRDQQHRLVARGSGHYHDSYERLLNGWVIKTCRLTRVSMHLLSA